MSGRSGVAVAVKIYGDRAFGVVGTVKLDPMAMTALSSATLTNDAIFELELEGPLRALFNEA